MMMPNEDHFVAKMKDLDIRSSDYIVVYDKINMMSAPRALWMFKNFGVDVLILNGTFSKWESEGLAIESGDKPSAWKRVRAASSSSSDYNFKLNAEHVKSFEQVKKLSKDTNKKELIVDARPKDVYD
jgi:thiosulfate/3-mercaptopyruvate sulfurtransferase